MILIPMTRSRSSHEAAWYERSSPCSLSRAVFIRERPFGVDVRHQGGDDLSDSHDVGDENARSETFLFLVL